MEARTPLRKGGAFICCGSSRKVFPKVIIDGIQAYNFTRSLEGVTIVFNKETSPRKTSKPKVSRWLDGITHIDLHWVFDPTQ